jgi:hypothetical protein
VSTVKIDPPHAVGPVHLGAPIDEAVGVLLQSSGSRMAASGDSNCVVLRDGLTISLEPTLRARVVRSVGAYGGPATEPVTLRGVSLLATPANEVLEQLARFYAIRIEDSAQYAVIDSLLVALWRPYVSEGPDDPEGRYFASVTVASPGYYEDRDRYSRTMDGGAEAKCVLTDDQDVLF